MTGYPEHVDVLADHSVLLAVPAFLPAFVVVGVVVYIALRDRRAGPDDESEHPDTERDIEED
ncbi:hypothetical protein [Nocardia paucivorans]|uniref:hypothetical protein n=1 Tax=Nocardia paucivorans TaxID=114259 RepID=UPI00030306E2|nr:hypothetical protein [Nocardia paucivorans]